MHFFSPQTLYNDVPVGQTMAPRKNQSNPRTKGRRGTLSRMRLLTCGESTGLSDFIQVGVEQIRIDIVDKLKKRRGNDEPKCVLFAGLQRVGIWMASHTPKQLRRVDKPFQS